MPKFRNFLPHRSPRKVSAKNVFTWHDVQLFKKVHPLTYGGFTFVALVALNIACLLQYKNWEASALGIFVGLQISYYAANAPELFSVLSLITAYVSVASESALATLLTADLLTTGIIFVYIFYIGAHIKVEAYKTL